MSQKKYLTNENLLKAIKESKRQNRITDELAAMLVLLANRIAGKSCFANYSYREDMVAEALCNLAKHALKFDETRSSNPFAFYTSAIMNSFYQYLNAEKKQRNIRDTLLIEEGFNASFGFMEDGGDDDFHVKERFQPPPPDIDPAFIPLKARVKVRSARKKPRRRELEDLLEE